MCKYYLPITITLLVIISSCDNKNHKYYNEKLSILNSDSLVTQEGNYSEGFKKGKWMYNLEQDSSYSIIWDVFEDSMIAINIPYGWIEEKNDPPAILVIKGETNGKKGKVLFVKHDKINGENTLKAYRKKFVEELNSKYEVVHNSGRLFVNQGKEFIFSKFMFLHNDEQYYCFSMLSEENDYIIESTYFFKDENWKPHYDIFVDIFISIKIDGDFLFPHNKETFAPHLIIAISDEI